LFKLQSFVDLVHNNVHCFEHFIVSTFWHSTYIHNSSNYLLTHLLFNLHKVFVSNLNCYFLELWISNHSCNLALKENFSKCSTGCSLAMQGTTKMLSHAYRSIIFLNGGNCTRVHQLPTIPKQKLNL